MENSARGSEMQVYIMPIVIALIVCFSVAVVLTLPWMIYQYRKYGFFSFWKTVILMSFIFYGLSAFLLVIFPIPTVLNNCSFMNPAATFTQLRPLQFIRDIERESGVIWTMPSTYTSLLSTPAFYQMVFNVLLLFPLGVYLRYFLKKKSKWFYAVGIGFGVSLFFELTQKTAIFGLFECPYRIFDVDDLLTNTLGAGLGFFLARIFLLLIPSREQLQEQEQLYHSQKKATFGAQLFEVILNLIIARGMTIITIALTNWSGIFGEEGLFAIILFVLIVILPVIWKGNTIGAKIIRLKLQPKKGNALTSFGRRYLAIYMPFFIIAISKTFSHYTGEELFVHLFAIGFFVLAGILWLIIFCHIVIRWIKKDKAPYFNQYGQIEALRIRR